MGVPSSFGRTKPHINPAQECRPWIVRSGCLATKLFRRVHSRLSMGISRRLVIGGLVSVGAGGIVALSFREGAWFGEERPDQREEISTDLGPDGIETRVLMMNESGRLRYNLTSKFGDADVWITNRTGDPQAVFTQESLCEGLVVESCELSDGEYLLAIQAPEDRSVDVEGVFEAFHD